MRRAGVTFGRLGALQAEEARLDSRLQTCRSRLLTGLTLVGRSMPRFPMLMPLQGVQSPTFISRATDLGDSIMTAIVLAPFREPGRASSPTSAPARPGMRARRSLADGADQVRREGGRGRRHADGLASRELHGAEIETYNDHRMAMCFAILGLKVPGIKLKNPACVKKTFPNFFQKLAAPPPRGLGARILDGQERAHAEQTQSCLRNEPR